MDTTQQSDLEIAFEEIAKEFWVTTQELIDMAIERKAIGSVFDDSKLSIEEPDQWETDAVVKYNERKENGTLELIDADDAYFKKFC